MKRHQLCKAKYCNLCKSMKPNGDYMDWRALRFIPMIDDVYVCIFVYKKGKDSYAIRSDIESNRDSRR